MKAELDATLAQEMHDVIKLALKHDVTLTLRPDGLGKKALSVHAQVKRDDGRSYGDAKFVNTLGADADYVAQMLTLQSYRVIANVVEAATGEKVTDEAQ